jgi:hypothetical protein
MRPPDNPPGNEKDREELGFLSGLDLTGTVDTALVEIRDSFKARFESSKKTRRNGFLYRNLAGFCLLLKSL